MTYDRDNHRRAIKVASEYAERIDALRDEAIAHGGGPKLLSRPDPGHSHAFRLFTLERERAALDVLRAIHVFTLICISPES